MPMPTKIVFFLWLTLSSALFVSAQEDVCSKQKSMFKSAFKKALYSENFLQLINGYDVKYHALDLAIEANTTYLSGSVITAFTTLQKLDTFTFELHQDLTIDSVLDINHQVLSFYRQADEVYVTLNNTIPALGYSQIQICYHGTPPSGASAAIGNGFSNEVSPKYGARVTWSLSQPYAAKEWWPCKQSLTDKIDSVAVSVTTSQINKVGSNGLLKQIVPLPNNKHRFEWKSNYPIDFYLIAVSVGNYYENIDYAKPKGIQDSILILNYLYNEQAYLDNKKTLGECKDVLTYFSECFGMYPFHKEKYGHSMAPFSGGMEHQTMTTLGIISYDIMVHELAHQWFGDYITCSSWSDLWLNEGFASYSELLAYEKFYPQFFANKLQSKINSSKQGIGSVYVEDTASVPRLFSSNLTYNKAGLVLHMLRWTLGDSLFFASIKNYVLLYGNQTANTVDFKNICEQTSGKNLTAFFQEWVKGAGYPTYTINWNSSQNETHFNVFQSNSQSPNQLFSIDLPLKIYFAKGDSIDLKLPGVAKSSHYTKLQFKDSVIGIQLNADRQILANGFVKRDLMLTGGLELFETPAMLALYPNPSDGQLTIQTSLSLPVCIRIFDLTGKLLVQQNQTTNIHTIELPEQAGLYVIELSNEQHKLVKKVMRNQH